MCEEKSSDHNTELSNHNAKLTTFLGVEYQYYVALDYLLKMNTWNKCLIEEHGDVTFVDDNDKQILNIEVKHNIKDKELKFHDKIFQNTICNWFKDRKNYTDKTKLLFITTRKISEDNHLLKWNTFSKEKKYSIVDNKDFKEYANIRDFFEKIKNKKGNIQKLKSLFEKIEIIDSYPKYPKIIESIKTRNALKVFRNRKDKNEKVLHKIIDNLHRRITKNLKIDKQWEVTYDEFIEVLREEAKLIRGIDDYAFQELLKDRYSNKKNFQYIGLNIIEIKKEKKQEKIQTISLTEPMDIFNHSSKSLIYGKAGVGKTTFCEYLSWQWGKSEKRIKEKFDYLIHTSLRKWKGGGLKGLIKSNYSSEDDEEILLVLKNNNQKILFLFDGYDELSDEKKLLLRDEITKNNLQNYIITSRPHGYGDKPSIKKKHNISDVFVKNDFNDIKLYEIKGFNDNGIDSFVDNFFDNIEKQRTIKEFLHQNSNIKNICIVPLLLQMICTLWQKENHLDKNITTTEIYSKIINNILITHEDENVYFRENRIRIKNILGKLSFESLKNNQVVFFGDLIEQLFDYNEIQFFRKGVIPTGFIQAISENRDILDNDLEFSHLSFQEYFSALYVSTLSKEEQSEIIRDWKFYPHMQMFFAFLGGLIEDKEFFLEELESEPRDLIWYYDFHLILLSVKEIKKVSEEQKDKIFKRFFEVLNIIIKKKELLVYHANELSFISHIINEEFIEDIFKRMSSDNRSVQYYLASSLAYLGKSDDAFIDRLINIFKDPKNDYPIIDSLIKFKRNDKSFIDKLFKLMLDINTLDLDKEKIANYIMRYGNIDIQNKLLDILEEDTQLEVYSIKSIEENRIYFQKSIDQNVNFKKKKTIDNFRKIKQLYIERVELNEKQKKIKVLPKDINMLHYDSKNKIGDIHYIYNSSLKNIKIIPLVRTPINCQLENFVNKIKNNNLKLSIDNCQSFLKKDDDEIVDILINDRISDDKRNHYFTLLKTHKNQSNILKKIINKVKENEDYYYDKISILNHISPLINDYETKINLAVYIIKDLDEKYTRYSITEQSLQKTYNILKNLFLSIDSEKIIETFFKLIENNKIDKRGQVNIVIAFISFNIKNDKIFQLGIKIFLEDNNSCENRPIYGGLSRENRLVYSLLSFDSKQFDIFKLLNANDYSKYIKIIKFSTLFHAYDEEGNVLEHIVKKANNEKQSLYIKNNKLYTVEDGEEIYTQREVDEAIINEIKLLPKRGYYQ